LGQNAGLFATVLIQISLTSWTIATNAYASNFMGNQAGYKQQVLITQISLVLRWSSGINGE
jgi:hypothetical protein